MVKIWNLKSIEIFDRFTVDDRPKWCRHIHRRDDPVNIWKIRPNSILDRVRMDFDSGRAYRVDIHNACNWPFRWWLNSCKRAKSAMRHNFFLLSERRIINIELKIEEKILPMCKSESIQGHRMWLTPPSQANTVWWSLQSSHNTVQSKWCTNN